MVVVGGVVDVVLVVDVVEVVVVVVLTVVVDVVGVEVVVGNSGQLTSVDKLSLEEEEDKIIVTFMILLWC